VSRGRSDDNADNLAPGVLDDLRSRLQGTQRGLEELDGIFSDDDAGALFRQEWIDRARRDLPRDMRRRVIAIDPAITSRKGSDQTGVSECGLGHDGQVYVIGDYTDRYRPEEWGDVVLDRYVAGACDCVIAETNRGGELVVSNLRARGESRQRIETGTTLRVLQLEEEAPTRHVNGVVYVKVVHARKGKDERAGPVASLYEQGKCSHVRGAKLDELEDTLCTWEPDVKNDSPDRMDPMVWAVWELAGLRREQRTDTRSAVQAAAAAMKLIRPEMPTALGALLRGGPQRGRI
jgi:phage terminase large subunit-like protein